MGEARGDHDRWARLRFAVVGPLLAAPPPRGALGAAFVQLAQRRWRHPIHGEPVGFSAATIERWYYAARGAAQDPVAALRRRVRRDAGQTRRVSLALRQALREQIQAHPSWSAQLHADNLAVVVAEDARLGPMPSTSTLRRYLKHQGWVRRPRWRGGSEASRETVGFVPREVRSYEAEYVHGLWHLDFHHGSLKVLVREGQWVRPKLLGILDDRSRLACHLQWYLDETAETLVHGLSQAIQKRGLPRALLTDNGSAMTAAETVQGLHELGIVHATTLPYSPYQNAKQEVFWAQVEGRLLAMLEGVAELTLGLLNDATQAWAEGEYHATVHRELGTTPLARYREGPEVGRESPGSQALRRAFRASVTRAQRRSDGTVSVEGRRFELPARYRTLERVMLRYARWDLSAVDLVDPRRGVVLAALYPLDKQRNAEGPRRRLAPLPLEPDPGAQPTAPAAMAPLLRKLLADHAATGLPPAYLPKPSGSEEEES
jgi:transposase InsO family protein